MVSKTRDNYISNRAWLEDIIGGEEVVLRGVSALEYLQLFVGYLREKEIDVYAKAKGKYDNVNYYIVDNFNSIDFIRHRNVLCSSFNQAVNDMLDNFENADEQALLEALCKHYYAHGKSFEGLYIKPENIGHFEYIKEWAIDYYNEG
jgi:hypothetical protein